MGEEKRATLKTFLLGIKSQLDRMREEHITSRKEALDMQQAVLEEMLVQTEKIRKMDSRLERIEALVSDHGKKLEVHDGFIRGHELATAQAAGESLGKRGKIKEIKERRGFRVTVGVAVIALLGTVIASSATNTIVNEILAAREIKIEAGGGE